MEEQIFDTPKEEERCRKRFNNFLKVFTRNYLYSIDLMVEYIHNYCVFAQLFEMIKIPFADG